MAGRQRASEEPQEQVTLLAPGGPGEGTDPAASDSPAEEEAASKETLLPVWGMVRLTPRELQVVDHPAFQRLFEIHQLGQTHLVYRGATHMRGEHAIGTLHAAQLMIEALDRSCTPSAPSPSQHWQLDRRLVPVERVFVRLAALLHDIGHLPAGHTLEDELGLLGAHDGDERIEMVLGTTVWHEESHLSLGELIDTLYASEARAAGQLGPSGAPLSASELLIRLISSDHKNARPTPGSGFRLRVCRDIVGNTICADLLDYLHRDWLHIGKPRSFDPRLLDYTEILTRTDRGRREERLVIDLGRKARPRPDAVTAILDLLESRYQLSEIALYHRAKIAAAAMLERAVAEYRDTFADAEQDEAIAELVPDLLQCSDLEALALLRQRLEGRRSHGDGARIEAAIGLTRQLRPRHLHRQLHVLYEDELGGRAQALQISERFAGRVEGEPEEVRASIRAAAENRLLAVRTLEEDFDLPPGSIVVYCPPPKMNTKIAAVGIYNNGRVDSLHGFDREGRITGGHLAAQEGRFERLWRIHFAIDRDAYERLDSFGLVDPLIQTIEKAVLWSPRDLEEDAEDGVRSIAETLTRLESSPHYGCQVVEPALNREQPNHVYPGGARSIRSFIGPRPESD